MLLHRTRSRRVVQITPVLVRRCFCSTTRSGESSFQASTLGCCQHVEVGFKRETSALIRGAARAVTGSWLLCAVPTTRRAASTMPSGWAAVPPALEVHEACTWVHKALLQTMLRVQAHPHMERSTHTFAESSRVERWVRGVHVEVEHASGNTHRASTDSFAGPRRLERGCAGTHAARGGGGHVFPHSRGT